MSPITWLVIRKLTGVLKLNCEVLGEAPATTFGVASNIAFWKRCPSRFAFEKFF